MAVSGPDPFSSFMRTHEGGVHLMQLCLVFGTQVARAKHNVDSLYRSGERERRLVCVRNRRAGIRSNAECVDAEASRDRVLDPRAAHFLAVDPDNRLAALA